MPGDAAPPLDHDRLVDVLVQGDGVESQLADVVLHSNGATVGLSALRVDRGSLVAARVDARGDVGGTGVIAFGQPESIEVASILVAGNDGDGLLLDGSDQAPESMHISNLTVVSQTGTGIVSNALHAGNDSTAAAPANRLAGCSR